MKIEKDAENILNKFSKTLEDIQILKKLGILLII